jgi:hypothetical protein
MERQQLFRLALAGAAARVAGAAAAQAPGEDPVVIRTRPSFDLSGGSAAAKPSPVDEFNGIPAWMRARIARYQARAFSAEHGGFLTDNDVVNTNAAQGARKTCVQEVGTSTTSGTPSGQRFGPQNKQQVVVLRGDLVNICN